MSRQSSVSAVLVFAALTLFSSAAQAQTPQRITVEWQDAPIVQVVDAFARFSGRSIVVAPGVADRQVTAAFTNLDWRVALDAIVERESLVARDFGSVIRIETPRRITAEWENASLTRVVDAFSRFAGRNIVIAPDVGERQITAAFQGLDWWKALDAILEKESLVARESAGVIHIERRVAPTRPGA